MNIYEQQILGQIVKILESEDLRYEINRKLPESSTRADLFIFSNPPIIIELIRMTRLYKYRKQLLISKLVPLKTINDGNIRVILILYIGASKNEQLNKINQKSIQAIKEDALINEIIDNLLIIDELIYQDKLFTLDSKTISEIKNSLKKPKKGSKLIDRISDIEEYDYSEKRLNYTLENIGKFPGNRPMIFSFYFYNFDESVKRKLEVNFRENWQNWQNTQKDFRRTQGIFYFSNTADNEFQKWFKITGWDFEVNELKAILYENSKRLIRRLNRDREKGSYFFESSFSELFLDSIKELMVNFDKELVLSTKYYKNIYPNLLNQLLNYCLLKSEFKTYLPLTKLKINTSDFRNYQKLTMDKKTIIFKPLNLNTWIEPTASISNFGKFLKGYFTEDVELIIFIHYLKFDANFKDRYFSKKNLILLEKSGWKTFPFQNFKENVEVLNEIYDLVV